MIDNDMKYFFSLRIETSPDKVSLISEILGLMPNYPQVSWGYSLDTKDNQYTNFVEIFLKILYDKYDQLERIGINREHISIWIIYEYEEQCNLEFNPDDMKNIGAEGISLCISCYQC